MKQWKNPMMTNLGLEETKSCTKHTHGEAVTLDRRSSSSDSSRDGSSSCSSDCPVVGGFES